MAITRRAVGASKTGTNSVTSLAQPAGTVAGDVLLAFIVDHGTSGNSTAPTGWQYRGGAASAAGRFQVFSAVVGKNSLSGSSWTFSGLTTRSLGQIVGYYNADKTGYGGMDVTPNARSNASGVTGCPTLVTVTPNAMIIAGFASLANGCTWSAEAVVNSTITEISGADNANSNYCSLAICDGVKATPGDPGTGVSSATMSSNGANVGVLVALRSIILGTSSVTLSQIVATGTAELSTPILVGGDALLSPVVAEGVAKVGIGATSTVSLASIQTGGYVSISDFVIPKYTRYYLNPNVTVDNIVNKGVVSQGVATTGSKAFFIDSDDHVHFFGSFGGFTNDQWHAIHVDLTSGVADDNIVVGLIGAATSFAFCPFHNTLYIGSNYAGGFAEYDVDTQTLINCAGSTPIQAAVINTGDKFGLCIGDDNIAYYFGSGSSPALGNYLYSYDHATQIFKEYGAVPNGNATAYGSVVADSTHVYAYVPSSTGWRLYSSPTTGTVTWTLWPYYNATDLSLRMGKTGAGALNVVRQDVDHVYYRYSMSGGTFTYIDDNSYPWGPGDGPPTNSFADSFEAGTTSLYGFDVDMGDMGPIPVIHEYSTVWYKPTGSPDPMTPISSTYTTPWYDKSIMGAIPQTGNTFFCLSFEYCAAVNIDYREVSPTTYIGSEVLSPYSINVHPVSGEYYIAGYPNSVYRYNPLAGWTLNKGNSSARDYDDPTKPNPYRIYLPAPTIHYRYAVDFDAYGLVWIGGNTTRLSTDYGDVTFYDPSNGNTGNMSTGYIFSSFQSEGTFVRGLCAACGRTLICVSDSNGNIWVINAVDQSVDTDPVANFGGLSKIYMKEVINDEVIAIVISSAATTSNQIIKFRASTKELLYQASIPDGYPFGTAQTEATRQRFKLEFGPDGYLWMFINTVLYRIDPVSCSLIEVFDAGSSGIISFAPNKMDMAYYGFDNNFRYISSMLVGGMSASRGVYTSLPSTDDDLNTSYTDTEIAEISTDDDIRVSESGSGYVLHEFKDMAGAYDTKMDIHCNIQVSLAPSSYPVYLQCYDRVTLGGMWVTVASDTTSDANTDFNMDFTLDAGSTPTFANCKDNETGIISSRIWQTNVPLS